MLSFEAPYYAYLLFLLPLIALLRIFADARARRVVAMFISSERLRPSLLGGTSVWWLSLHFGLQILGLAFLIIAMTRPQWGTKEEDVPQMGRDVFIAVDCSKSMLSDDMTPNRITRAKLAAQDLLEKLQGDRVALVAFAGRAFLQAPLTTDHDAVRESIQALDYTTIPRGGSSLAAAIDLVLDTVDKMPAQHHGLILFTDGQETDNGTIAAAKRAKDKHLLILPVGMGTAEGSLIPDPDPDHRGEYLRNEAGQVVKTKLESALLQEVASITGARYLELSAQPLTQNVVDDLMAQLDRQSRDSRHESHPIERYQWPLCVGILCCILSLLMRPSSRRTLKSSALPVERQAEVHVRASPPPPPSSAVVTLLCCLLMVGNAGAAAYDDVKQAEKDYQDGRFDQARETYRKLLRDEKPVFDRADLSYGLAATDRSLKDYDGAVLAYSDALKSTNPVTRQQALRGLASSLYDWGDERLTRDPDNSIKAWEDSIDHFEAEMKTLKKDSDEYKQVRENRNFVQKRLDELQKQLGKKPKLKKQKMQSSDGAGDDDEEQEGEKGKQQKQDKGQGDKPQKEGQGSEKEHDTLKKAEEADVLPEGDLKAVEDEKKKQQQLQAQRALDEFLKQKYGFTEEEARQQLRNYADDQKTGDQRSLQYLMKRGEPPAGGKDY